MTLLIAMKDKGKRDMRNLSNGRSGGLRIQKSVYVPRNRTTIYGDPRGSDPRSIVSGRDNYWQ